MLRKKILIVVAHPDDELLGAGGTLKKHLLNRDDVRVIILSKGKTSRDNFKFREILKLNNETNKALKFLGVKKYKIFDFPDNKFDTVSLISIIKTIEEFKKDFRPNRVYTHFLNDLNIDHRITAEATITAFRPLPNEICTEILSFEIPSSTDLMEKKFSPNYFIDISKTINSKIKALSFYKSEMKRSPHPRSLNNIKAMSIFRGNQFGVKSAEAFEIIRILEK